MEKKTEYVVVMSVKFRDKSYGRVTKEFKDHGEFESWWGGRDEFYYKVIGIIDQGFK